MKLWKKLPISYKIFITLLLTISLGQIFMMVYIWNYESKILYQKEQRDLYLALEAQSQKLSTALENKQKETQFLASLEVMDDLIANDLDKRVSSMLERKAADLEEEIILLAVKNGKIISASKPNYIEQNFQVFDDKYLYFTAPTYASFNPKVLLGKIILLYPFKNLANLSISKSTKLLWLTPPHKLELFNNPKIDKNDYLMVSQDLKGTLSNWKIHLAYQKDKAFETLNHIKKMLLYTFLFALGLLILTVWLISKNLLKGVQHLSKTSQEIIQTKDYTKQVVVESDDEIGQLSSSFNTLISQTNSLLTQLDAQSKKHFENLIKLISFFNTITQTKDRESTLATAKEEMLHFNEASNMDKRFLDATSSMVSLQLERISLLDSTKEALEAKSLFLSTISHELRTPLGSILNLTQHLMVSQNLKDEDVDMLSKIETSATHLLGMINNILDISKLESNKLIVHKQKVNLKTLLEEIIEMIEPLTSEKELQLIQTITINDEEITTDPQLFKQVVINILSNALKYTNKGSITLSMKQSQNQYLLKVTDTGIGIEPKLLNHVFQEFYQSSVNLKNLGNSSGLGLALSKKVAHLLEGNLEIFSEGKNRGTTLYLPLALFDSKPNPSNRFNHTRSTL
jgi:signal transduction histidine kinase